MPVTVTVVFKDGSEKVFKKSPLGIDRRLRMMQAINFVFTQLNDEEWDRVIHYQLEDDFL